MNVTSTIQRQEQKSVAASTQRKPARARRLALASDRAETQPVRTTPEVLQRQADQSARVRQLDVLQAMMNRSAGAVHVAQLQERVGYRQPIVQRKLTIRQGWSKQELSTVEAVAQAIRRIGGYTGELVNIAARKMFNAGDVEYSFEAGFRVAADRAMQEAYRSAENLLFRDFESDSGSLQDGAYKDAASDGRFPAQSNDAEVGILQGVTDFLEENREAIDPLKLLIKQSKGPCTSCRGLLRMFRERFPGLPVVLSYSQDRPEETQELAVRGADPLTYGWANSERLDAGFFYKRLGIESPARRPKGMNEVFAVQAFDELWPELDGKSRDDRSEKIDRFLNEISRRLGGGLEFLPDIKEWFQQMAEYRQAVRLLPDEMDALGRLGDVTPPAGSVRSKAVLFYRCKILRS